MRFLLRKERWFVGRNAKLGQLTFEVVHLLRREVVALELIQHRLAIGPEVEVLVAGLVQIVVQIRQLGELPQLAELALRLLAELRLPELITRVLLALLERISLACLKDLLI